MNADFNVSDPVFEWAERAPQADAVVSDQSSVSYAALCAATRRAAARFDAAGWRPGDVIGVCPQGPAALDLAVSLALARLGLVQIMLPPGDPGEQLAARVRTLGVKAICTVRAPQALAALPCVAPDARWLAADAAPAPDLRRPGGEAPWIVIQSSGTTATPKEVVLSHRVEYVRAERLRAVFSIRPGERFVSIAGFEFWSGLSRALRCLSEGGSVVEVPPFPNAQAHLRWFEEKRVTCLSCAPVHIHHMLQKMPPDRPGMPWLRMLRSSSAALPAPLLAEARRRMTPNIYVNYGVNELGVLTAANPDMLARDPGGVGLPVAGIELELVDAAGRPVRTGALGQVRVRGDGMLAPLAPGQSLAEAARTLEGWQMPGDSAVRDAAGVVSLKGRVDDLINFDGMLISPAEIEAVLAAHPAVVEAAAFRMPMAEHQDVPSAAVVLRESIPIEALRTYCNERLGRRAPKRIFRMDALPRNAAGKVLRRKLSEMAQAARKRRG